MPTALTNQKIATRLRGRAPPDPVQLELISPGPAADPNPAPPTGRVAPPGVGAILAADAAARAGGRRASAELEHDGWTIEAARWGSDLAAAMEGDWVMVRYALGDAVGECVVADDPLRPGARVVLGRESECRRHNRTRPMQAPALAATI